MIINILLDLQLRERSFGSLCHRSEGGEESKCSDRVSDKVRSDLCISLLNKRISLKLLFAREKSIEKGDLPRCNRMNAESVHFVPLIRKEQVKVKVNILLTYELQTCAHMFCFRLYIYIYE